MSRPLVIDAAFWRERRLTNRSPRARLLWLACLQLADDRGRIDLPFLDVVNFAFPDIASVDAMAALRRDFERLVKDGLLRQARRADGRECLRVCDWDSAFTRAHRATRRPRLEVSRAPRRDSNAR